MGIVDEDIARVREATDIVALISQYTQLRRVGTRWSGLCPFHAEKTPSFSVNATEGFYYCFGCAVSGDAITFVREKEQLDFVGAVESLASKAGITLRYTDRNEGEGRKRQARLFELTERAAQWYHDRLRTAPDAAAARSYLRSRGFDADQVAHYRLGWAPDSWDELVGALKAPAADIEAAGLGFVNRRNRLQDFFRGRVLFPIIDERDRVVGFGGRKLPGSDGPKYQNSRDNALYNKSRVLYGLNWAKADAVNRGEVVVCEGYTDVIGFARAGIPRAVATCGTALTEDHIRRLKRFTRRLVLAYDADDAGQAAAARLYQWERTHDVEIAVVALPAGTDPDDLAASNPELLRDAVESATPFLAFRLERVLGAADLATVEGRARAAEDALEVIAEHPDPFVRDPYLMEVADRCRLDGEVLRERLRRMPARRRSEPGAPRRGAPQRDPSEPLPEEPGDLGPSGAPVGRDGAAPTGPQRDGRGRRGPGQDRSRAHDGVQIEALRLAIHHPEVAEIYLSEELFDDPVIRDGYRVLRESTSPAEAITVATDKNRDDVVELLTRLVVETSSAEWYDVLSRLATEVGRSVLLELEAEVRIAEDPLAYSSSIAWLKRTLDTIRGSRAEVETLEQLLAWLTDRRRLTTRG